MAEAQPGAPDLNTMPDGAQMADPDAAREVAPVYAPHNMRIDRAGNFRGYGDPDSLAGDDALDVEFYVHPIDGLEHIRLAVPGEKNMEYDYLADDGKPPYTQRFARQYAAFKEAASRFKGQTLLRDVTWIDAAVRARLAEHKVHTLEQLASVSDNGIRAIGPGTRKLRDQAAQIVADRVAAEEGSALRGEIADLKKQLAELRKTSELAEILKEEGEAA